MDKVKEWETSLRKIVKSLIKYSSNLILIGNKEIDLHKKEALLKAKDLYQQGKKSLFALFEILNVKIINQEEISHIDKDLLSFWSINTPQDYEKAKIVNSFLKASLT